MHDQTESCVALWCAVLERAILDELEYDLPKQERNLQTKDFFNKGEMFPLICDLIGVDVGWTRRKCLQRMQEIREHKATLLSRRQGKYKISLNNLQHERAQRVADIKRKKKEALRPLPF